MLKRPYVQVCDIQAGSNSNGWRDYLMLKRPYYARVCDIQAGSSLIPPIMEVFTVLPPPAISSLIEPTNCRALE